jgi:hypothetical protein
VKRRIIPNLDQVIRSGGKAIIDANSNAIIFDFQSAKNFEIQRSGSKVFAYEYDYDRFLFDRVVNLRKPIAVYKAELRLDGDTAFNTSLWCAQLVSTEWGNLIIASRADAAKPIEFWTYDGVSFTKKLIIHSSGVLEILRNYFKSKGRRKAIKTITTATYTLTDTDEVILADASAAAITITLPTAVNRAGQIFTIKKVDLTANSIAINVQAGESLDGNSVNPVWGTTTSYEGISVISDGANWFIVGAFP